MMPKIVDAAVERANKIANGPWPPVWRHPPPSQTDAVWDALETARSHVEAQTGIPMERQAQDTPGSLVIIARARVLDADLHVNAPKAGNQPFKP
jgi:hypothetical protein